QLLADAPIILNKESELPGGGLIEVRAKRHDDLIRNVRQKVRLVLVADARIFDVGTADGAPEKDSAEFKRVSPGEESKFLIEGMIRGTERKDLTATAETEGVDARDTARSKLSFLLLRILDVENGIQPVNHVFVISVAAL